VSFLYRLSAIGVVHSERIALINVYRDKNRIVKVVLPVEQREGEEGGREAAEDGDG
jgi:hypothetical protein